MIAGQRISRNVSRLHAGAGAGRRQQRHADAVQPKSWGSSLRPEAGANPATGSEHGSLPAT